MITDVIVDGFLHDLPLKWRPTEQGFEIIEIRKFGKMALQRRLDRPRLRATNPD
jgi:hypothetical protein